MKTAIFGTGSLGTALGALLVKQGVDIDLIDKDKEQVEALRAKGARVSGAYDFTVPVNALYPEEMTPGYDVIFLATKIDDNKDALPYIKKNLKEDGVLATLQNGLPEEQIASVLGSNRVLGCPVDWSATLVTPGHSVINSDRKHLFILIGKMKGVTAAQLMNARNILEKACTVHYEHDLYGARWSKMLINTSYSAVATVIGGTMGDAIRNWKCRDAIIRSAKECIKVGEASGAVFTKVNGINHRNLCYYHTFIKKFISMLRMPHVMRYHLNTQPTMLYDIQHDRTCGVDNTTGLVVEMGKKYGISTPTNLKILNTIHKENQGLIPVSPENIKYLR